MGTRFQHGLRLGAALATALLLLVSCGKEHDLVTVPSTSTLTWHRHGLSVDLKPTNWPLSATLLKNALDLNLPSLSPTQAGWMRQRPRYWMHRKGTTTGARIHLEWGNY